MLYLLFITYHACGQVLVEEGFDPFSNLIEVYIRRLRRKIDHGHEPKLIRTLRGEGYSLKTEGEEGCD